MICSVLLQLLLYAIIKRRTSFARGNSSPARGQTLAVQAKGDLFGDAEWTRQHVFSFSMVFELVRPYFSAMGTF